MSDLIYCSECKKIFDTEKENIREDYIDVCPMDTADARHEVGYFCEHCGHFNIRCYAEEV